jgi:hypothetical protein
MARSVRGSLAVPMSSLGPCAGGVADGGLLLGVSCGRDEKGRTVDPVLGPGASDEALLLFTTVLRGALEGSTSEVGAGVSKPAVAVPGAPADDGPEPVASAGLGAVEVADEFWRGSAVRSCAAHGWKDRMVAAVPPASTSARKAGRRHQARARRRRLLARASMTRSKRPAGGVASACSSACRKSLSIMGLSCMDGGGDGVQSDL